MVGRWPPNLVNVANSNIDLFAVLSGRDHRRTDKGRSVHKFIGCCRIQLWTVRGVHVNGVDICCCCFCPEGVKKGVWVHGLYDSTDGNSDATRFDASQRFRSSSSRPQMNGTAESPPTPPAQRPAPSTLTTLPQVLSALSSLESEEAALSNSLSALLADQQPILASLARLQSLLPRIDELHTEASALSRKVSVTARTAERVGGRVRALDEEMRRVREANDRVQQVMELKVLFFLLSPSFVSLWGGRCFLTYMYACIAPR
jgi:hypothetical protein